MAVQRPAPDEIDEDGPPPDPVLVGVSAAIAEGLPTITLPVIHVQVRRGLEVIKDEVFEHELPILEFLHGPSNVELIKPPDGEEFIPRELVDNAFDEFNRLEHAYANKKANLVRAAYPRGPADLAAATGLNMASYKANQAPQSATRRGGKDVPSGPETRKKQAKAAKK